MAVYIDIYYDIYVCCSKLNRGTKKKGGGVSVDSVTNCLCFSVASRFVSSKCKNTNKMSTWMHF